MSVTQSLSRLTSLLSVVFFLFMSLSKLIAKEQNVQWGKYRDPKEIRNRMEKHKIIPDLHTLFTFYEVHAEFQNGKHADMGNELSKEDVKEPPKIKYDWDDDAFYTLVMTDLDAPSPEVPNLREWQHWLVVNIPQDNITAGETLSEYIAPGSQNFTGKHRYVITTYRQPGGNRQLKFDETHLDNKSDYGRIMFSTNNFAQDYDYGDPTACQFWYTTHDHKRWY